MRTSREPKTEGVLEAHRGGDTKKGLAVDGGWRTSAKRTDDAGPKKKHKQEKKWKTTRNQQNREKAGKDPKVGKTAARGARPVQAKYRCGRGIGSLM